MDAICFLTGRAGQVLPEIIRRIGVQHHAHERVLLLVPEQYTLQAERELVEQLNLPGFLDLDVLSPTRLRRRIRESGGQDPLPPLDARGRSMALSQALVNCQDSLRYYRRVAAMPGLPDKVSSLLSDMAGAGMDASGLHELSQTVSSAATSAKLNDLATIWQAYDELLAGRFADETAQQEESRRRLALSGVVTDAHLWVYGFDVLPQPLCELLCVAAPLTRSLTVTMTMDGESAADGRIFLTQRKSVGRLMALLEERQLPCLWERIATPVPGRDAALAYLESKLFARQAAPFTGDASAVSIHLSATPFAEASYAAQTLRQWHAAGIPWSRMAIALSGSASTALAMTLKAANIPHYMARKDTVLRHGLCRMLLAALHAACESFRQEDVLEFARSGYAPITDAEAMLLENYALENGVHRDKWLRAFTRGKTAQEMEPLRQRLTAPLIRLRDGLRSAKTATESLTAIYGIMEDTGAYTKLLEQEQALLSRGMAAEAAQNRQVWQLVLDLLDQLHALLGQRRAPMKDVARFVASGLAGASVSSLPPVRDTVMVGEAGHLMPGALDALLVMGLQDGVLASEMDSLLSDSERESLSAQMKRSIGITMAEQSALRLSDFYRTLSLPRRYLTLTFSGGAQDGTALRPASLIADVRRLLPKAAFSGGIAAAEDDLPLAPLPALEGLSLRLRAMADGRESDMDETWRDALRYLWHSPAYAALTKQMLAALDARIAPKRLSVKDATLLFGQDTVSISRLEEFAGCPYRHFVDYGLKPIERREYAFEADERGTFFHEALREYATLASAMPQWPNVDDAVIDHMMDQILSPLTQAWENGPLTDDAMGRQLGRGYLRTIRRAAKMFTEHSRNSRFTTWGAEVAFGQEGGLPPLVLTLPDGRKIALRGVIDRIDRFEGDHGVYLRVVDYKSSRHALTPVRMWYGLQLQLLLYLKAASQGVPGSTPAGAFYFTVRDPQVDTPEDLKAAAEQAIARELRLKGVVLADSEVVDAMDHDQPGFSIEKVFNQDGTPAARASAVNLEQMHDLLAHAEKTASRLAQEIRSGVLDVSPAEVDGASECVYCAYAAICRRDPHLPGGESRQLPQMEKQEFLECLANEESTDLSHPD